MLEDCVTYVSPSDARIKLRLLSKEAEWFSTLDGGYPEAKLIAWAKETFGDLEGAFLDIGANCGTWTLHLAESFAKTFSFEPHPDSFQQLRAGIRSSAIAGHLIEAFNVALGDRVSVRPLRDYYNDMPEQFVRTSAENWRSIVHVPTLTLDQTMLVGGRVLDPCDWRWKHYAKKIKLVKIDVEGFEHRVLQGAECFLKEAGLPPILFEAWKDQEGPTVRLLQAYGYNVAPITWPETYLATKAS